MALDQSLLHAALIGYQNQLAEIENAMAELRRKLRIASPAGAADNKAAPRHRTMSPAARRRIAAAQKKRWAAYRKAKASK